MLIQLVCLLSYFISRDVTLESCFFQMQIIFLCEWMKNYKDNYLEHVRDLKRAINIRSWAGLHVISKLKQARGLVQMADKSIKNLGVNNMCLS